MRHSGYFRKPLVKEIVIDFTDGRRKFLENEDKLNIAIDSISVTTFIDGGEVIEIFPAITILRIWVKK